MAALTAQMLAERLAEARDTRTLSLGYLGLETLPADLVDKAYEAKAQAVSCLDLSSNKLSQLPDLSQLKHLQSLQLKYNFFTALPPTLLGLPRLEVLELAGNQLFSLDERILAALPKLRELDVSSNQLTALPDTVVRMPALQQLVLDHNALEYLPDNIGTCTTLVKLVVGTNRLAALPSSLGLLPRLQRLDASANLLTTVPAALGAIKTLKEFNLRYNHQLDPILAARSEEGLSKLLGHLREEAERERLAGIEALKPVGVQAGVFIEYRMKADAAQRPRPGQEESTGPLDNRCWVRSGYTLTRVGAQLVMLGGMVLQSGQKTIDAFWVTDDRMEWHRQTFASGEKPSSRDGHSCVFDGNRIIMFGGCNHDGRRLNDVWALDTDAWAWKRVPTMGAVPTARHSSAAVFHDGNLIVFGGSGAFTHLNDVWMLETGADMPAWRQLVTGGTGLGLRHSAGHCLHDGVLYIHGGYGNFVLSDLHALDLNTMQWRELGPFAKPPPNAQGHQLTVHGSHLYLIGGTNELNAPLHRLFRLNLAHVAPEAKNRIRPVWEDLEVDMPWEQLVHVETLACLLQGGRLELCTSRPNAQGRFSDDPEQTGVLWNIYRASSLHNFRAKSEGEAALPPGQTAKTVRVEALAKGDAARTPPEHQTHSRDEQAMLEHVETFLDSHQSSHPDRLPLFIAPRNERGVPKFVCNSMQPMQCQHPLLADLDSICSFVADFILYEPLSPIHALPPFLISPSTLLQWQAGDAFDMANLLCCLLLGIGYDALLVVGSAPATLIQGATEDEALPALPSSLRTDESDLGAAPVTDAEAAKPEQRPAYKPTPKHTVQQSEIAQAMQDMTASLEQKEQRTMARASPAPGAADPDLAEATVRSPADASANDTASSHLPVKSQEPAEATAADPLGAAPAESAATGDVAPAELEAGADVAADESRAGAEGEEGEAAEPLAASEPARPPVHAWVLLLKGKRGVTQDLFIEASSGKAYPVDAAPYACIEHMWNQHNFWVATPSACGAEAMAEADAFDLDDSSKWRHLLDHPAYQHELNDLAAEDVGQEQTTNKRKGKGKASAQGSKISSRTGSVSLSRAALGSIKPLRDRNVSLAAFATHTQPITPQQAPPAWHVQPCMPAPWIVPEAVTADMVDRRCPGGMRSRAYQRCIRESFAWAGLYGRWDGLAERITFYEDDEKTKVTEVREVFQRRMDKLRERRTYPVDGTSQEVFNPGAAMAVTSFRTARDGRYEVRFKARWRHDGLVRRVESGNGKLVEEFHGRDDGMVYRSARFSARTPSVPDHMAGVWASPIHVTNTATAVERSILKLTERYAVRALPVTAPPVSADHADSGAARSRAALHPAPAAAAPAAAADSAPQALRRTFYMPGGDFELVLHRRPGHLVPDHLLIGRKGALKRAKLADPLTEPPNELKVKGMAQDLNEMEIQAVAAVREGEKEVSSLVELRRQQECSVHLAWSYPEADREVSASAHAAAETTRDGPVADYLSSFLPARLADSPSAVMTPAEARDAKMKCQQAMHERLAEREGLIKARRAAMVTSIAERQAKWEKEKAHLSIEEAEVWDTSRKDDAFKLAIIDKRLRHHEEVSKQQQQDLQARLADDPRLSFSR